MSQSLTTALHPSYPLDKDHQLEIRLAKEEDLKSLESIINSSYRAGKSNGGWTDESSLLGGTRILLRGLLEIFRNPNEKLLVAVLKTTPPHQDGSSPLGPVEKVVGCVHLRHEGSQGFGIDSKVYFGMLSVHPKLQGLGIGKKLIQACEQLGQREWQAKFSRICVFDSRQELLAWYKKLGYKETGETCPFVPDDEQLGKPLTKLNFIYLEKGLN